MPPTSQTIAFEGYFAEGVLGIFKIIRGFADLRDLATVSVPYELNEGAEAGRVVGHQRQLNEKHALDIKKYLEQSDNRKNKMPFDLTTFKYVPISQAAEIPNTIKSEIIAILRDAGAPL
jgi:hypothetical protein